MSTIVTQVLSPGHEFPDHPERPGRFELLDEKIKTFTFESVDAMPATRDEIARVHSPRMIQAVEEAARQGPGIIDYAPTYVTHTSFTDALLASGGTLGCVRAVWGGDAANAFALVRPPGHHAEPTRAMGFCLFNNVAVAARDLLERGAQRVLVIDYDAHHGNGTEAAFLNDERLGYLSTHQWGIYPGTGRMDDAPHAKGRIVNVPLPAYAGDSVFAQIFEQVMKPHIEMFRPEMILVSVGFDAHWSDPITMLGLSSAGYHHIAKRLVELANEHCKGKIVFVLEGGYSAENVASGAGGVLAALNGGQYKGANDASPHPEPDITRMLESIRAWHGFV